MSIVDLEWGTVIPAGNYTIGDEKSKHSDEKSRPAIISAPYQLARYPITNAQFDCFVQAKDVNDLRWWAGMPEDEKKFYNHNFQMGNHPRANVSWYQAKAFCRWLSFHTGENITLPHENQWEVAARYAGNGKCDGRVFPWGDDSITPKHANYYHERALGKMSPVGSYPLGRQPHSDLYDLSGNVWEWCANKYDTPDMSDVDQSGDYRTLRGGSWNYGSGLCRAAYRNLNLPRARGFGSGFRVVRVISSPPVVLSTALGFAGMTIRFEEIDFPSNLTGYVSYVGHPATKMLIEALGATTVSGRWNGPSVGESYIAVPLANNTREGGYTQDVAIESVGELKAIRCTRIE